MKNLKILGMILGLLVILVPAGFAAYNHFAKTWQVAEIQIRQDKYDLYQVRRDIADLENKESERTLTDYEERRLRELREQSEDIRFDIKSRGK